MALDTVITGANLDAGGNVKTALTNTPAYVGGVRLFTENDAGDVTGTPYLKSPETSPDYRLRVGTDTVLFTDTFNANAQNISLWSYTFATMTASQPGTGFLQFGTIQGTTASHGCFMRTFQYFPVIGTAPLAVEFKLGVFTANLVTGEIFIAGLGTPSTANVAPTEGVWFKLTNAGLIGELSYNGVATQTGTFAESLVLGELSKLSIIISEEEVEFWANDILLGEIAVPHANGQPFMQGSLPAFMQRYNTAVVSNTAMLRVTDLTVSLLDVATTKPWSHQMAGMGQHILFGQNGHTQGKTTLWTNNTPPTAVALTNTAAAFTGLGGIVAVLPTLAAGSDGKLITYLNPVPSINLTGRNIYITRVTLNGVVSVILAGGPVVYLLMLAVGHTATSLATTDTGSFVTATGHAPRIMPLGVQTYAATAAVGAIGGQVDINFNTPIVVRPGEYIDIVARNIGTVTTTGAITFTISIGGYWE